MEAEGRSAVWGGLTWAVGVGVIAAAVAALTRQTDVLGIALRFAAGTYVALALLLIPGEVRDRVTAHRQPLRNREVLLIGAISVALVWVAFLR
jgi:hypothetical protein